MSLTTSPTPTYSLTYTFAPRDSSTTSSGLSVTVEAKTNDSQAHKEAAFAQLARMYGLPSAAAARDRWTVERVGIGWANAPWNDWDELEATLESLPGVTHLRYEPPYPCEGAHGPPTYHLRVEDGRADAVRIAVKQYYAGLRPLVDSPSRVRVLVSPSL